ncbi:hypothetical protein HOY80DRAFT_1047554 [Tuber brumale]|nr:hypothetical protein HOY80DRAFT_1047554 [Tuber brumale]
MLMSVRERAITSANILAAFRGTAIWPMNSLRILQNPTLQITDRSIVAPQQSPTRTSKVDEIAKLEVQALQSHNIDQIKAIVTEIALIGRKSLASANMNAELLKQVKEKRQASKTDRQIISKAQVIGLWELTQLKKKKKLADEMKKKEKQKKKLEISLDTTAIRKRISLTKEQQDLSQNGGRILEDEKHYDSFKNSYRLYYATTSCSESPLLPTTQKTR